MAVNKIRELNDQFRRTFCGGKVLRTVGVASLSTQEQAAILAMVQGFDDFNKSNDPYGEHDFGAFDFDGITYFWKIDYYDHDYLYLSPDAADPNVTNRVLTIIRADEY